jgi:hypothetical protein
MLTVTNKALILSVIMLNVVMLSVVALERGLTVTKPLVYYQTVLITTVKSFVFRCYKQVTVAEN